MYGSACMCAPLVTQHIHSSQVLSVPSRLLVLTSLGALSLNANTLEPLSYLDLRGTV